MLRHPDREIQSQIGDQQSALLGQAAIEIGQAKCTYGTGSFLLTNIGNEVKLAPGLLTTVAWHLDKQKPVYAFEGAIFIAGAAIQWLRDGLGIIESSNETEQIARGPTVLFAQICGVTFGSSLGIRC